MNYATQNQANLTLAFLHDGLASRFSAFWLDQIVVSSGGIVWHYYAWAHCSMEHVSVWGSVSAVDHRSIAALELMPKGGEVIPLALSRYDTLKKKLETCGGFFGDQADHGAFFPWCMAEKK